MGEKISDFGTKYVCFECGCKFYDLHKPEPVCPRCNTNQKNAPVIVQKAQPSKEIKAVNDRETETDYDNDVDSVDDGDFPNIDDFPEEDDDTIF
jgi:uncharacterized protein (TIGR02300 family)